MPVRPPGTRTGTDSGSAAGRAARLESRTTSCSGRYQHADLASRSGRRETSGSEAADVRRIQGTPARPGGFARRGPAGLRQLPEEPGEVGHQSTRQGRRDQLADEHRQPAARAAGPEPSLAEVNQQLGTTLKINIVPSSDYAAKLGTVMAGSDLPELLYIYQGGPHPCQVCCNFCRPRVPT